MCVLVTKQLRDSGLPADALVGKLNKGLLVCDLRELRGWRSAVERSFYFKGYRGGSCRSAARSEAEHLVEIENTARQVGRGERAQRARTQGLNLLLHVKAAIVSSRRVRARGTLELSPLTRKLVLARAC